MDEPAPQFAIVHHPATQGHPQLLGRISDPNEATVLLDREVRRLRKQGRGGEVLLIRSNAAQSVVLRLPLVSRPRERVPRVRPRPVLASAPARHPGWSGRRD